MDDLPNLLSGEYGIRPQGKAAPMSASRGGGSSGKSGFSSMRSGNVRSNREVSMSGDSMQMDGVFGNMNSSVGYRGGGAGGGGLGDLDGIFGGGGSSSVNTRTASSGLDSVFGGFTDPMGATKPVSMKAHSGPIFDKPVYDDDMFDGIPGLKTSLSTEKFDDVFASFPSNHQRTPIEDDDLLGDLSGKGSSSGLDGKHSPVVTEQTNSGFDDLIPGFGDGGSSPQKSDDLDAKHQQTSSQSNYQEKNTMTNDPFADLDSKSVPAYSSSNSFINPLDGVSVPSGKANYDTPNGLFDDINNFSGPNNSMPHFSSDVNGIKKEKNILKSGEKTNRKHPTSVKESSKRSAVDSFADTIPDKGFSKTYREPTKTQFDMPSAPVDSASSSSGRFRAPSADSKFEKSKSNSIEHEDIWLTVSEVPLFTQPTSAPPPSRSPPPFTKGQNPFAHGSKGTSVNLNVKRRINGVSSIDELEEFAMGKSHSYAAEAEVISSDEENETNLASAATTAAVDRATAKIKQARESRERREIRNGRNSEFSTQVKKEKVATDLPNQEFNENFGGIDPDQEQIEREEKEKEKRRVEKERAAVDRALNEARGRAAVEARDRAARQKAERAAVEKANSEARERAARASVQKATAEARERAARASVQKATAEARERAAAEMRERAEAEAKAKAAEARERAIAETKEKEAREAREKVSREKAAVQRATQDARLRAERAAVEKATREARERAAASAREKQQKNETDLDSMFGMGSRATSEPKQRAATPDYSFEAQTNNKGESYGAKTASSVSSSSGIRKTSSANILDDLSSVFGGPSTSGDFQEIDGETEERRKARFERDQRTRERTKKALDEKNQRDMQVHREQVERE
ncbi:hypothetical protein ZOSMA_47G00250, partial [Zostera marina]